MKKYLLIFLFFPSFAFACLGENFDGCGVCVHGWSTPAFSSCNEPGSLLNYSCVVSGAVFGSYNEANILIIPSLLIQVSGVFMCHTARVEWEDESGQHIRDYYNRMPTGDEQINCGGGIPPVCSPPYTVIPPCQCGCETISSDVCREKETSASTCDYSCPSGSYVGADGHCFRQSNGKQCLESECPDQCITCPDGYDYDADDALCYGPSDWKDVTAFGLHDVEKFFYERQLRQRGKGGYEKRDN